MSHVTTTPDTLAAAAGDLATVGSTINAANKNAAVGTSGVQAPGGDSVSAFVVALFAAHAQAYQDAGAQAASYHNQFVHSLRASAGSYARTEDANASPLQKVSDTVNAASQTSAGHLIENGANGAAAAGHLIDNGANGAAAQHGGVNGPLPGSGAAAAPSSGTPVAGGPVASGGDGHSAAVAGPQGGNSGGGGGNGAPTGDGGATSGGGGGGAATGGGGGGGGEVADPRGAGGGVVSAGGTGAAGAGVPAAWAPAAPALMTGGYPAAAGLAGLGASGISGHSAAFSGFSEPLAPPVSAAAASPVAEPAIPTAPKAQQPLHQGNPLHHGNPAHQGDAHPAHADHDKAAVPLPLPLRLPSLRGLRGKLRLGLRDKDEWKQELREAARSKPWGREELLGALGLRPPGSE